MKKIDFKKFNVSAKTQSCEQQTSFYHHLTIIMTVSDNSRRYIHDHDMMEQKYSGPKLLSIFGLIVAL